MLFVALGYFKLPFRGRGPHWSFRFFPLCQLRATELNESGCPTQCFETHRSQPEQLRHLPFKALISCAAKQRCGGDIRATCLGRPPGRWRHGNGAPGTPAVEGTAHPHTHFSTVRDTLPGACLYREHNMERQTERLLCFRKAERVWNSAVASATVNTLSVGCFFFIGRDPLAPTPHLDPGRV